jgi:hypothetical protein
LYQQEIRNFDVNRLRLDMQSDAGIPRKVQMQITVLSGTLTIFCVVIQVFALIDSDGKA